MNSIPATRARADLFHLLRKTVKGHRQYRITCRDGGAVLLSEEDYESLLETLELLSMPGLLGSIKKAKREIHKGQTYSLEEVFGPPLRRSLRGEGR